MTAFTIYGLIDPRDHRVHYVGCTARTLAERLREHRLCEAGGPRKEWIDGVLASGHTPSVVVLSEFQEDQAEAASASERFWIDALLGNGSPLTNVATPPTVAKRSAGKMRNRWREVRGCEQLRTYLDGPESISAAELARRLGVGENTINFWKTGFRRPSSEFRAALQRIAGIHPDAWMTPEELSSARRARAA